MAVYIWNTCSHLQRWESMHHDQQIFHIGKEWFYVRLEAARCCEWQWWLQLSLQNRKKKKGNAYTPCQKHLQHSGYACNWSERHLTPAVQLRDIPQDKYDMAECDSRWKAFISKCCSPYCLCCKPLDDRECDLTKALYNLRLRWNIWLFRNM